MNAIPIIGWALSLVFNTSMAVPFWIIWTVCGIGEKYFYFVPEKFLAIPFWDCVKTGKAFRLEAAAILGTEAPAFITAALARDKTGTAASANPSSDGDQLTRAAPPALRFALRAAFGSLPSSKSLFNRSAAQCPDCGMGLGVNWIPRAWQTFSTVSKAGTLSPESAL